MSALPPKSPATIAPFSDAFGFRVLGFDKKSGDRLEMLRLRPQLASSAVFEAGLRDRQKSLAEFRHPAFARVRQVDRPAGQPAALAIVSNHADGQRLSDVLRNAEMHEARVDLVSAMCVLRQVVASIVHLHEQGEGLSHGALTPERFVLTATGRVILTEYILGAGLSALSLTPQQAWQDFRVTVPAGEAATFDQRADIHQLGYIGLTLVYGRSMYERAYPPPFAERIEAAEEIQVEGRPQALHPSIVSWLTRTLLGGDGMFSTALEAQTALDEAIASAALVATPDVIVDLLKRADGASSDEAAGDDELPSVTGTGLSASAEMATENTTSPVAHAEPGAGGLGAAGHMAPAQAARGSESWSRPQESEPQAAALLTNGFAAAPADEGADLPLHASATNRSALVALDGPPMAAPEPAAQDLAPFEPAAPAADPELAPARAWTPPSGDRSSDRTARAERSRSDVAARSTETAGPAMFARYGDSDASSASAEADTRNAAKPTVGRPYLIALGMAVVMVAGFEVVLRFFNPFNSAPARATSASELGNTQGTLSIDATPQAKVFIDDAAKGTTPVRLDLTPGLHNVRLEAQGHGRSFQVNVIAGKEVSQVVELSRSQDVGTIEVKSEPAGARVLLDGKAVGVSPLTLSEIKPGAHALQVEGANGAVRQVVQVVAGATASILVPLNAALPANVPAGGWISVDATEELQVFEGGKLLGTSRSERIMVPAGTHEIELRNEAAGFTTVRNLQVQPGKLARVSVQLPDGSLSLNAVPWAEVWLDGQRIGETPVGNLTARAGTHELIFRHPQHGEIKQTVVVKAGEIGRVTVNMAK